MILYGAIIAVAGLSLLIMGIFIFIGHINLISTTHTENIKKEKQKIFCRGIGIQLTIGSLGLIISGILSLIIQEESFYLPSVLIAFIPLFVSIISIFIFIKIFNKNIIS